MLRVVLTSILAACVSACSVGYISLPLPQTTVAKPPPRDTGAKTALGGPKLTPTQADAAPHAGFSDPGALDLINEMRFGKGLPALEINASLTRAAQMHASTLARLGALTHVGLDGTTPMDRVRMTGYQPSLAAENIAGGQENIVEAIRSWRESEAHLRNMLLPDATQMGLAQAADPKTGTHLYWVLVLAAPRKG